MIIIQGDRVMKKEFIVAMMMGASLILGGCANTMYAPSVSQSDAQRVMSYETGTVTSVRGVVVKDNGTGSLLGAVTGAVLGHMVGGGHGKDLATLGGGLLGAYAGSQAGAANAQELTVRLDNGKGNVVVVAKGIRFNVGSRVRIVSDHGKVVNVDPI